jgi:hypothetical protein
VLYSYYCSIFNGAKLIVKFGSMLKMVRNPRLLSLFFVAMGLLMAFQCDKYTPSQCLNAKISSFQNDCCASGASVKEYTFQQESVFVFDQGPCGADFASYVLTSNCDTLGFLGGFAGNTVINGEEFSNAVLVGTVWSN